MELILLIKSNLSAINELIHLKRKITLYNCEKFPISCFIQFPYFLYNFIPCLVREYEFNCSCLN